MSIFEVATRGCDFCGGVPSSRIEALPVHFGGEYTNPGTGKKVELQMRYEGDWAVCSVCQKLVEARDRDGLAE